MGFPKDPGIQLVPDPWPAPQFVSGRWVLQPGKPGTRHPGVTPFKDPLGELGCVCDS